MLSSTICISYFIFFIALVRTLNMMLKRSGEKRLFADLSGKGLNFSLVSMMLALDFL